MTSGKPKRNRTLTDKDVDKLLSEGRSVIRWKGKSFSDIQRAELYKDAFNRKHKCFNCGKKKDIQIHHLNEFVPAKLIDTYEEYIKVPWIALCKRCHMVAHSIQSPESTDDD